MNIKDYVVPFLFALATAWLLQRFVINRWFAPSISGSKDPATFMASQSAQASKPLNTEVDFFDNEKITPTKTTQIETEWGIVTFSTQAGSLERVVLKRIIDGEKQLLTILTPPNENEKEQRCFLVAFQENTPYYYTLEEQQNTDDSTVLIYQAQSDYGIVRKIFTVHNKVHQIDLNLSIDPKKSIEPRIFFAEPYMQEVVSDVVSAIVIDEANVFTKQNKNSLPINQGWLKPTLFGSDTRYMIHAMIDDANVFAQRAYYKHSDNKIFSVLENESISKPTEWKLSFYLGPKEADAVAAVDDRLEQTFEYSGYLAPISRILIKILNFLYKYVHNYGFAIILLTVFIKLLLLPFTIKSEAGMKQRTEMQKKLQYLQKKYKNEPDILARERAELIRKHGMPGLGGCLPLLLQIPIFFALSRILANSIELYHAPMLWIPDLSASDPYYILPIGVTLAMLAQAAISDSQQRMSVVAMAFVFGAFTTSFSAGLALYIFVSTLLGVLQTQLVKSLKIAQ